MFTRRFSRLSSDAGLLLLVVAGIVAANLSGLSGTLDDRLSELRFETQSLAPSGDVVLVDIDARSLAEVGVWPWPRSLHGDFLRAAEAAGAVRVAFDVDFSASSTPEADLAFTEALAASKLETFLAAFVQQDTAAGTALRPSMPIEPFLQNAWPAVVNVSADPDGRIRRFPFALEVGTETIASMPAVLAGRDGSTGVFGIDYAISLPRLPRVSYVDVLNGRVDPRSLAGKTLIVGASALELHDLFTVPVYGVVSGSTIIALATETLSQGRELAFASPPTWLLVGLGLAALLAVRFLRARHAVALFAAAALAVELLALVLQTRHSLVLATSDVHLLLAGFAVGALAREFDLRRLLLWVARAQAGNSQSVLERVIDDGFDGVVIFDDGHRITRINGEACTLLGLQRPGTLSDLPPQVAGDVMADVAAFRQADASHKRTLRQVRLPVDRAERTLEYSVAPFWMTAIDEKHEEVAGDAAYACLTLRDVTERERAQDKMRFMALHDSLTGLCNRRALEERLGAELLGPASGSGMALLCFDLDRFKGVNDALGHSVGDKVLVETARRAQETLGASTLVARIGGDEFSALLLASSLEAASAQARLLVEAIARPFLISGHRISIDASVGINWWADVDVTATSAMRHADVALYRAKRSATEQVVVFEPFMDEDRLARLALEQDLGEAFDKGEFHVVYQPQVRLASGDLVGAEALVRWEHPIKGLISPVQFIPVAEEMGLIHRLGIWVLEVACVEAMRWPVPLRVAVNVSALQFETGDLVSAVRHALEVSTLPASRLELEITESAFVGESGRLKDIFDELLAIGVSFALDDFGTGYSSLGYLHRFPISKIKIDRSFVTGIPTDGHSMAVLRSVRALADGLGIHTIAEGIETEGQAEVLRILGCDDGQGYLFSKPLGSRALQLMLEGDCQTPRLEALRA